MATSSDFTFQPGILSTIVQAKSLCLTFFLGGSGVSPGLVPVTMTDAGD